jgi:hypothetical protein
MREHLVGFCLLLTFGACGERRAAPVTDRIRSIPYEAQRRVSRAELGLLWPLKPGTGTIGCLSGAIVFRTGGIDYALNDLAKSRGFVAIDRIWESRSEGPPSNPLKRITQDRRKQIFAELRACEKTRPESSLHVSVCKQRLRQSTPLSEDDLRQIESEGVERLWPPQAPARKSTEPLLALGLKLCQP